MEQQQVTTEVLAALPIKGYISTLTLLGATGEVYGPEPMGDEAEPLLSSLDVAEVLAHQRGLRLAVEEQLDEALKQNRRLGAQVELLTGERNAWEQTANMFARGQDYYQGIVRDIGSMFPEAYICDDGGIVDEPLAEKVVDCVCSAVTLGVELYEQQCNTLPRRVLRGVRNLFTSH